MGVTPIIQYIHLFSCLKTFYGPCNVVVASLKLVPRLKRRQAFLSSFFFALRAQRFLMKANAVMESEFPNFNESNKDPNMNGNLSFGHGLIDACFILSCCTVN